MKEYKLIKEYPGSPKLNTIIHEDSNWVKCPGNYPEYWKEVTKDYEILSFRHLKKFCDGSDGIYEKKGKRFWMNHPSFKHNYYSEEEMLNSQDVEIYSVKRLSDGQVFTVGDIIWFLNVFYEKTKIHHFGFFGDRFEVHKDCTRNVNTLDKIYFINNRPLFTTEDGVDIFMGSTYWWVNKYSWQPKEETITDLTNCGAKESGYNVLANFSTKEKAEEYILLNKPCLSFKDIINYLNNFNNNYGEKIEDYPELLKTVKSKININT